MKPEIDVSVMESLPGDKRELVLFLVQDISKKLTQIEDLLADADELETGEEDE